MAYNHYYDGTVAGKVRVKIIQMSKRRLYLAILLLITGCQQASIGADKPKPAAAGEKITETEPDRQLKINKDALLKGASEQIRIDAATVMLYSEDPSAGKILLDTLKQSENAAARIAVCKALSLTRGVKEPLRNKEVFIQPLLDILKTDDSACARLAAEAMVIFDYEQISKPLEGLSADLSLPARARLNAVYALQLQPDMKAIFKLIELLDDLQKEVAAETENALVCLGIPTGKDTADRKQIVEEIKRKGKDKFMHDRLIRQESQMRGLTAELKMWQELYLSALGKIYDGIDDDAVKGKFLVEHLGSSETAVKLWTLEKAAQWWTGTGTKSVLLAELGPVLTNLISDADRDVRLKTAGLLALMVELNSAEKLLERLKIELDDEVRTELFVALSGACYYASSPGAAIKVSPETRKQTLEWAVKYLAEQAPGKARKGADAIRKLLEQEGTSPGDVDKCLGLLVERYNRQDSTTDGNLRADLLGAMAGLCSQSLKAKASRLFEPLFEQALNDETDSVREAAVDGLIYIDKTRALGRFRKTLGNDRSNAIKRKIIDLAGEVGGQEDLPWLAEKLTTQTENEPAWQTMLKIFNRSEIGTLNEWTTKLGSQDNGGTLSDKQMISLLETAEGKADSENSTKILKDVREKMSHLYSKSGDFERAAKYFGMLRKDADSNEEKESLLGDLLDAYLKGANVNAMRDLVANCLLEKDLDANSVVARSIDNFLKQPPAGTDPNAVLGAISRIRAGVSADRPMWQKQLRQWVNYYHAAEPNKPK